jgi:hypothetical protein
MKFNKDKFKELLNDYSSNFNNTINSKYENLIKIYTYLNKFIYQESDLNKYLFEVLGNFLERFDFLYIFSDNFGTYQVYSKKENEIILLIELLNKIDKTKVENLIKKYNVNEHGVKF